MRRSTPASVENPRWVGLVGAFPVLLCLGSLVATVSIRRVTGTAGADLTFFLPIAAFAVVGGVIFARQPRNRLGWIFAAIGVLGPLSGLTLEYGDAVIVGALPRTGGLFVVSVWLAMWTWVPLIAAMAVGVPLLFPDGRLPGPRWRAVAWPVAAAVVALAGSAAFSEQLPEGLGRNPLGVPGVVPLTDTPAGGVLLGVVGLGVLGAIASVVVRSRRARGIERQQLKWFTAGAALLLVLPLAEVLPVPDRVVDIVWPAALTMLPLTVGFAVLRYRLYEIDRVISRTLSYAILTGVLLAGYAVLVVTLQAVLAPVTSGSDLAVAASTLAVAAAFGPVRRRVQSLVDRRFNRARYDAQRTVASFSQRLRHEVHLDALTEELTSVAGGSVHPRHASVWLPPGVQSHS